MSTANACRDAATGTLDAGVGAVITIETNGAATIGLVIKNTGGSNAINTTKVEKSPLGNLYGEDTALGTAIDSIATGASVPVQISARGFAFVKVTLTSTSGTTYSIEYGGVF